MFERVAFNGLNARVAKRRALNYWYAHRRRLDMSVAQFFGHCRQSSVDGLVQITFHGDRIG